MLVGAGFLHQAAVDDQGSGGRRVVAADNEPVVRGDKRAAIHGNRGRAGILLHPEFRAAGHVERAAVGDEQGAAVDLAGRRATEIVRAGDGRVARADLDDGIATGAAVGDGAGPGDRTIAVAERQDRGGAARVSIRPVPESPLIVSENPAISNLPTELITTLPEPRHPGMAVALPS